MLKLLLHFIMISLIKIDYNDNDSENNQDDIKPKSFEEVMKEKADILFELSRLEKKVFKYQKNIHYKVILKK